MHNPSARAGAFALTAGLCLTLPAVPAHAAATSKITVRTLDRSGKAVTGQASLVALGDSGQSRDVTTGRPTRVARGTYAVTVMIGRGGTLTTGTQVVKLGGDRTVTFDARKGRRVTVSVDDPDVTTSGLLAVPVVDGGAGIDSHPGATGGGMYVLPTSDKRVGLAVSALLERRDSTYENPGAYRYDLVHHVRQGIPAKPVFHSSRAKLARVDMHVRSGDAGRTGDLALSPLRARFPLMPGFSTPIGPLPRTFTSYRTPGWAWSADVRLGGGADSATISADSGVYKAGRHSETWGNAVWGPQPEGVYSATEDGNRVGVYPRQPFCPPGRGCDLSGVTRDSRLHRGGTLVGRSRDDLIARISSRPGWYTYTLTATRSARLSNRLTLKWRFKTRRDPGGIAVPHMLLTAYHPRGLNSRNEAARGSLTAVPVVVHGGTPKTLKIEASTDGGRTWRDLAVKREGKHWIVQVRNPGAAGSVSLRSTVTARTGDSAVQTIVNAYGVR